TTVYRPGWMGTVNSSLNVTCNVSMCLCPKGMELRVNTTTDYYTAFALYWKNQNWVLQGEEEKNKYILEGEIVKSAHCLPSLRPIKGPQCPLPIVLYGSYTETSACNNGILRTTDIDGVRCTTHPEAAATCTADGHFCGEKPIRIGRVYCS
ncbi:hypothetical protein PMAYCL1PPCAC_18924, partial [Pristionchus mayeri]